MRALMLAVSFACGLDAAHAATVTLITGEALEATITARDEASVTVDHPVLGAMTIPMSGVTAIKETNPDAVEDGSETVKVAGAATTAAEEDLVEIGVSKAAVPAEEALAVEEDSPSFWAALMPGFDSQLELGISGAEGNTETADIRVGLRTNREDEKSRMQISVTYRWSTSSGETIRNQGNAFIFHDWLIPDSPWFTFVNGNYDFDQFRSWDHRVSGFGGFGYGFVETETLEMTTRLGGGATKEFGGVDDIRPEGLISGALVKWKPTDAQTVTAFATLYPDLSDFFEFRFLMSLEWFITIDQADGLSLKFGIENEYESMTAGGEKNNDLKYYGALVIDF